MNENQKDRIRIGLYRNVLLEGDGPEVLADVLNDLSFMSMHVNEEAQVALNNYARMLLWKCGIWREENIHKIVSKLGEIITEK